MNIRQKLIISLIVFVFSVGVIIGVILECRYTQEDVKYACEIAEEIGKDFSKDVFYKEVEKVYLSFDVQHETKFKIVQIRISGANVIKYVYDESNKVIFNQMLVEFTLTNCLALTIASPVIFFSFIFVIGFVEMAIREYRRKDNE